MDCKEIEQLRAQLATAKKALETIIKTEEKYAVKQSYVALAQIDGKQKGGE